MSEGTDAEIAERCFNSLLKYAPLDVGTDTAEEFWRVQDRILAVVEAAKAFMNNWTERGSWQYVDEREKALRKALSALSPNGKEKND